MGVNFAGALVGGLVTILSPCGALLLPAFFAYAFASRGALFSRTAVFFAGVMLALVPLGAAVGSVSALVTAHRYDFTVGAGALVIVLGLLQIFAVPLPGAGALARAKNKLQGSSRPGADRTSWLAMLLLGVGYGLAGAGCTGPILGAVLLVAATSGSPLLGSVTMAWYALGMAIPVIALAALWKSTGIQRRLKPRTIQILGRETTLGSLISGIVLITLGAWLIATGGSSLGGMLSAGEQANLESRLLSALAAVPNTAVISLIVAIAAATALIAILLRRRR